jgi:hypothetical protein
MNGPKDDVPCAGGTFIDKLNRLPPEYIAPYRGKQVAWSRDGTRILASGDTIEEVYEKIREMGLDPSQVVGEYIEE